MARKRHHRSGGSWWRNIPGPRRLLIGAAVLLTTLIVSAAAVALNSDEVAKTTAPDLSLTTADGRFNLAAHRGEVVLLYFSFPG